MAQWIKMPNLASWYQRGIWCWDSESHESWKGPSAMRVDVVMMFSLDNLGVAALGAVCADRFY
jgi:hypothetical protein